MDCGRRRRGCEVTPDYDDHGGSFAIIGTTHDYLRVRSNLLELGVAKMRMWSTSHAAAYLSYARSSRKTISGHFQLL